MTTWAFSGHTCCLQRLFVASSSAPGHGVRVPGHTARWIFQGRYGGGPIGARGPPNRPGAPWPSHPPPSPHAWKYPRALYQVRGSAMAPAGRMGPRMEADIGVPGIPPFQLILGEVAARDTLLGPLVSPAMSGGGGHGLSVAGSQAQCGDMRCYGFLSSDGVWRGAHAMERRGPGVGVFPGVVSGRPPAFSTRAGEEVGPTFGGYGVSLQLGVPPFELVRSAGPRRVDRQRQAKSARPALPSAAARAVMPPPEELVAAARDVAGRLAPSVDAWTRGEAPGDSMETLLLAGLLPWPDYVALVVRAVAPALPAASLAAVEGEAQAATLQRATPEGRVKACLVWGDARAAVAYAAEAGKGALGAGMWAEVLRGALAVGVEAGPCLAEAVPMAAAALARKGRGARQAWRDAASCLLEGAVRLLHSGATLDPSTHERLSDVVLAYLSEEQVVLGTWSREGGAVDGPGQLDGDWPRGRVHLPLAIRAIAALSRAGRGGGGRAAVALQAAARAAIHRLPSPGDEPLSPGDARDLLVCAHLAGEGHGLAVAAAVSAARVAGDPVGAAEVLVGLAKRCEGPEGEAWRAAAEWVRDDLTALLATLADAVAADSADDARAAGPSPGAPRPWQSPAKLPAEFSARLPGAAAALGLPLSDRDLEALCRPAVAHLRDGGAASAPRGAAQEGSMVSSSRVTKRFLLLSDFERVLLPMTQGVARVTAASRAAVAEALRGPGEASVLSHAGPRQGLAHVRVPCPLPTRACPPAAAEVLAGAAQSLSSVLAGPRHPQRLWWLHAGHALSLARAAAETGVWPGDRAVDLAAQVLAASREGSGGAEEAWLRDAGEVLVHASAAGVAGASVAGERLRALASDPTPASLWAATVRGDLPQCVALVHVALEGGGAPLFASLADMRAAAAWTVPLLLRLAAAGHADLAEAALLSVPCGGARALPAIDVFQRLWDSFGEGNAVEALWERDSACHDDSLVASVAAACHPDTPVRGLGGLEPLPAAVADTTLPPWMAGPIAARPAFDAAPCVVGAGPSGLAVEAAGDVAWFFREGAGQRMHWRGRLRREVRALLGWDTAFVTAGAGADAVAGALGLLGESHGTSR